MSFLNRLRNLRFRKINKQFGKWNARMRRRKG